MMYVASVEEFLAIHGIINVSAEGKMFHSTKFSTRIPLPEYTFVVTR